MGNVLSCCHNLSGQQIQPKEVRTSVDPEWSPLLSEENSDEDCPSPSRATGEGEKSPVLDQGHAFFPDIVLSSSPGAALAIAGHSLRNDQGVWNPGFVPDNGETVQAVVSQPSRGEDAMQVDLHAVCSHEKPELSKQTADPTEKDTDHNNKHNIVLRARHSAHMDPSVEGAELDVLRNVAVDDEWAEEDILWSDQRAAVGTQQHMEHNANQKQQGVGQTGQGAAEQMEQRTVQTEQPLDHGVVPNTAELVKARSLLSEHKSLAEQGADGDQSVGLTELGLAFSKNQNAAHTHGTERNLVPMEQNVAQTKMDLKMPAGQIVHQSGKDAPRVRQGGEQATLGPVQPQGAAGQLFPKSDQAVPTDQELMPVYLNVSDEALQPEEQKEQLTLFMVDRLFLATPPITGMM